MCAGENEAFSKYKIVIEYETKWLLNTKRTALPEKDGSMLPVGNQEVYCTAP